MPERRTCSAAAAAAFLYLGAAAAHAQEAPRIEPGAWEILRLTSVSGVSEPRLTKTVECIRGQILDPAVLAGAMGDCRFVDRVLAGSTLTWRVRCGATPAGIGELTVAGESAHGGVHLEAAAQAQTGFAEIAWSAKRAGPCPETPAPEDSKPEPTVVPRQRAAAPPLRSLRPHTQR